MNYYCSNLEFQTFSFALFAPKHLVFACVLLMVCVAVSWSIDKFCKERPYGKCCLRCFSLLLPFYFPISIKLQCQQKFLFTHWLIECSMDCYFSSNMTPKKKLCKNNKNYKKIKNTEKNDSERKRYQRIVTKALNPTPH